MRDWQESTLIEYRDVRPDEVQRIADIDRSEHIDGAYAVVNGALELTDANEDAPTWSDRVRSEYAARLRETIDAGGHVVGAFSAGRMVGFASLEEAGVGGDPALLKLDMLYVSAESRGLGIGGALTEKVAVAARSKGAAALYISATPTRRTVDAYLRMGAELLAAPDAELFALEPEDVHLVLRIEPR